jgi:hypothetical protein
MPLHEPRDELPAEILDEHRAITSLIEELEAVIWYHQRAACAGDGEIKSVLEHNRNEEIEHAMMLLEWLRRNFPGFQEHMETYLFQSAPITQIEEEETGGEGSSGQAGGGAAAAQGSLNVGNLKGE